MDILKKIMSLVQEKVIISYTGIVNEDNLLMSEKRVKDYGSNSLSYSADKVSKVRSTFFKSLQSQCDHIYSHNAGNCGEIAWCVFNELLKNKIIAYHCNLVDFDHAFAIAIIGKERMEFVVDAWLGFIFPVEIMNVYYPTSNYYRRDCWGENFEYLRSINFSGAKYINQ